MNRGQRFASCSARLEIKLLNGLYYTYSTETAWAEWLSENWEGGGGEGDGHIIVHTHLSVNFAKIPSGHSALHLVTLWQKENQLRAECVFFWGRMIYGI